METEESGWTKGNLQKLLAAMKASIPEGERVSVYTEGLKTLNWEKVAFPPFSPAECKQKWREIFQKMRKIRTLTELIVEAEDVIANPLQNQKSSSIQSQQQQLTIREHQLTDRQQRLTVVASAYATTPGAAYPWPRVDLGISLSLVMLIHPDFPKKPVPPNAMYYEENYSKIQKQHPEMSILNLFKTAAKEYKVLPDEEKAHYLEKYKTAFEEYKKKKLEFRKQYDTSYRVRKTKNGDPAKAEEGLPPKPPLSGYSLFCKEVAGQGNVPKKSYMSVWSQRWRDLSEKEKCKYAKCCRELKRQYATKLHDYLMGFDEDKRQQIMRKNNLKMPKIRKIAERKTVKKLPGEPKMPSKSGNVIFCQNQMKLLKDKIPTARERFVVANKMWQNISTKEKDQYKVKVLEKMKIYSMELQKWFKTLTAKEQQEYQIRNPSKCQYLDAKKLKIYNREELCLKQPSDSEDEDIDSSSDDEEENIVDLDEEDEEEEDEEEEDDDDDIMFEMY